MSSTSLESLLLPDEDGPVTGIGVSGQAGGKGKGKKRGRGAGRDPSKPIERKTAIRHGQLAPAQLLNPMGRVPLERIPSERLWQMLSKGNDYVVSFSELCQLDYGRQQVGISRTAEVLTACIQDLLRKEAFYKVVLKEAWRDLSLIHI